jgi:hypothetical protein
MALMAIIVGRFFAVILLQQADATTNNDTCTSNSSNTTTCSNNQYTGVLTDTSHSTFSINILDRIFLLSI